MDSVSGRTPVRNLSRRSSSGVWEPLLVPGSRDSTDVSAAAAAPDGRVWFGTSLGIAVVDPSGRWTTWEDDPLLAFRADVIALDPAGSLWFLGGARVRVLYSDGSWARVDERALTDAVRDIAFAPNGDVWFAGAGISVLTPD
jgi:hypothetical protein